MRLVLIPLLVLLYFSTVPNVVDAQDCFIGQITYFAGNFAPQNWAFCNGQLMPIVQNTALFSILGTTYGGDGISTFALPNMQSRVPIHPGTGPGLSPYILGQVGGEETHKLVQNEMPAHSHTIDVNGARGTAQNPTSGEVLSGGKDKHYTSASPNVTLAPSSISTTGGSQPHNNIQPYLGVNCLICLFGIFPSRS